MPRRKGLISPQDVWDMKGGLEAYLREPNGLPKATTSHGDLFDEAEARRVAGRPQQVLLHVFRAVREDSRLDFGPFREKNLRLKRGDKPRYGDLAGQPDFQNGGFSIVRDRKRPRAIRLIFVDTSPERTVYYDHRPSEHVVKLDQNNILQYVDDWGAWGNSPVAKYPPIELVQRPDVLDQLDLWAYHHAANPSIPLIAKAPLARAYPPPLPKPVHRRSQNPTQSPSPQAQPSTRLPATQAQPTAQSPSAAPITPIRTQPAIKYEFLHE